MSTSFGSNDRVGARTEARENAALARSGPEALHSFAGGTGEFNGIHTFAAAGVYTVEVIVDDSNTGVGTAAFQFVVVYDPDGGFVSGAGWVDVPTNGARAQYKGEGTINGDAGYCFMLTAIDGQVSGGGDVDRLRLKIWTRTDAVVVFDNLRHAKEDDDANAISKGNIVINP